MGYELQAFIGKETDLAVILQRYSKAKLIALNEGFCIIPLTENLYDQINNFVTSDTINKSQYLTENIEKKILAIISDRAVAYIEADFIGGQGGQNAVVWKDRQRQLIVPFESNAINKALRYLGAKGKNRMDEFDVVGLGKHRNMSDWIDDKL